MANSTYTFQMVLRTLDSVMNSSTLQSGSHDNLDTLFRGLVSEGVIKLPEINGEFYLMEERFPLWNDLKAKNKSKLIQTLGTRLCDVMLFADSMQAGIKSFNLMGMSNDPAAVNNWVQAMNWNRARLMVMDGMDDYKLLIAPVWAFIVDNPTER